jgi:phage-related tail fiber protein
MNFTNSNSFVVHPGTGQPMHLQAQAVPTQVTDRDMNSVIWSLMELLKSAGVAGQTFDPAVPASYQRLLLALQTSFGDGAGRVDFFARNSPPTGYLKANGATVSRSVYSRLFTALGTTFGIGDGSTTFVLPDLRGEFLRGWDDGRTVDTGRVFGSAQSDQNKSHQHDTWIANQYTGVTLVGGAVAPYAGGVVPPLVTGFSGGNESRPRNLAFLACIKF